MAWAAAVARPGGMGVAMAFSRERRMAEVMPRGEVILRARVAWRVGGGGRWARWRMVGGTRRWKAAAQSAGRGGRRWWGWMGGD